MQKRGQKQSLKQRFNRGMEKGKKKGKKKGHRWRMFPKFSTEMNRNRAPYAESPRENAGKRVDADWSFLA